MESVVIKEEIISDDELKNANEDTTDRGYTHDGYYYICDKVTKKNPKKVYLRCKQIGKGLCKARATLIGAVFTITKPHNHCPNDTAYAEIMFKKALRERCLNGFGSAKTIYYELLAQHLAAAERMPFSRMENSMHRWLKKFNPPMPNNLNEFCELIQNNPWRSFIYNSDEAFREEKISDDTNEICILIFYNISVLKMIEDSNILYIDSSYKVIPTIQDTTQIVTLLTVKPNVRSQMGIPFLWALTNKTTEAAYKLLLRYIKNVLIPNFNPSFCMLSYEKSLNMAMIDVFPNIILLRTYYNYCQSILRMATKLNIIDNDDKNPGRLQVLYKIMALALLPATHIESGFEYVRETVSEKDAQTLLPLLDYFEHTWMKTVSTLLFSVFDAIDRMNNLFESYHRTLQYIFQPKQGALEFIKALLKLQSTVKNDVMKAKAETITKKPSVICMISEREAKASWKSLVESETSVEQFINSLSEAVAKGVGTLRVIESTDIFCREEPETIEGCVSKYELEILK